MPEKNLIPQDGKCPASLSEQLTQNFYSWEKRGRGWQVWNYPVALEPPFRPFFHQVALPAVHDDGRIPSVLERVAALLAPPVPAAILPPEDLLQEPEPQPYDEFQDDLVELQVILPPALKVSPDVVEQLLLHLSYLSYPVSFEVIGFVEKIVLQLVCKEADLGQVRQSLRAFFPEVGLQEKRGNFLAECWGQKDRETVVADFGLSREFMLPLKASQSFDVDPLLGLVACLEGIGEGELGLFQVLFQKTTYPWAESAVRSVLDGEGGSFFADAPQFLPLTREKLSHPLFSVVVRVAARSRSQSRSWQIVKSLGSTLTQFSNPASNELMPLSNDGYNPLSHQEDVVMRWTRRSGMLLNSEELASLVHLPSESVRSEKLRGIPRKTKCAPAVVQGHGLVLGENEHQGTVATVSLSEEQRARHTYIIGSSGTGKSTLLLNLMLQDIEQGKGIGLIDPHGDLVDAVLARIPDKRIEDVVLFDPSDSEYPIGFNILSAHSELERNLLASDLVAVFRRLSTSWGDQMNSVLANAIIAFLESTQGGTLADLRRFLVEKEYRATFLRTVNDQEVVYYWQKEFPLLTGRPQAPILTRLDAFLRPKLIRHLVVQKESKLDLARVMNDGKIFLAKLSQGTIGEENAALLGAFLVSKFHQTALSRQEIPEARRRPFFLYLDEFHNFSTPSMAAILQGVRKFKMGLTLAHQELQQLHQNDGEMESAVLSAPCTRICFQVGDQDAKKLSAGFTSFEATDLQNLGIGEAICRVEKAAWDFNLKTVSLPKISEEVVQARRERIRALSRSRYAATRSQVEAELQQRNAASLRAEETTEQAESPEEAPKPKEPPARRATEPKPQSVLPKPATPGRGGQQHKYLQSLIKSYAEDNGYRAEIEKQVSGGSVDVALEKGGRTIACEISITSTRDYELNNIRKCLAAEFQSVVLISPERKTLNQVKELAADSLEHEQLGRVQFLTPEEFFAFLEAEGADAAANETTVRGYKIKTSFRALDGMEKEVKKQTITQTILRALKRLKDREE